MENKLMELKNRENKGFTLMEMLIVVAIIAVLIAIAIPTFTGQLNRARVATDEANARSGYASAAAEVLTNGQNLTDQTFWVNKDGSVTAGAAAGADAYATAGDATAVYTNGQTVDISGHPVTAWGAGVHFKITYTAATNKFDITTAA